MNNLLEETLQTLRLYGLSEDDVEWVGGNKTWFTWEDFKFLANVEYDEDYGVREVAEDLIIVGKDWWLERGEYDGKEWWEFKSIPTKEGRRYKVPKSLLAANEPLIFEEENGEDN